MTERMVKLDKRLTKEEIMNWILSKQDLSFHLTENGFGLAVGFSNNDTPTKTHYGQEADLIEECLGEIIDVVNRLKENMKKYEREQPKVFMFNPNYIELQKIFDGDKK